MIVLITFLIKKQKIIGVKVGVSLFIDPYLELGVVQLQLKIFHSQKPQRLRTLKLKPAAAIHFRYISGCVAVISAIRIIIVNECLAIRIIRDRYTVTSTIPLATDHLFFLLTLSNQKIMAKRSMGT